MSAQLAAVLELTDRVQEAINAGEWLRARELDVERRNLLEQLVVEQAQADKPELHTDLSAIAQRNNHMIGEVHHHRRRVLREASMVKTGHAAAAAYDDAPGGAHNSADT